MFAGTTTTSLLAALSVTEHGKEALQIALVHLMFNINGILLFYPIPWLRFPVFMADKLGKVTSKYRWFSVAYLLLMFFLFPAFIFGLSLAGKGHSQFPCQTVTVQFDKSCLWQFCLQFVSDPSYMFMNLKV